MRDITAKRILAALCILCGALSFGSAALAEILITVTSANGEASVEHSYTLEELDALPQTEIATTNEFFDGRGVYRGPLARDVIALLGDVKADRVIVTAINDYVVEIPLSDFEEYDVVLTTRLDGNLLSRRDKGPIWIMYPMDDHPELRNPVINARLVWQTEKLELR